MNFVQVFLAGAALILFATLVSLRRAHIRVEYSVSWLGVGFVLLVLAALPRIPFRLAAHLGLNPQIFFLIVAAALVSGLVFEVSLVVSKLRDENVVLAQRLAILEYHLQKIQSDHGAQTK